MADVIIRGSKELIAKIRRFDNRLLPYLAPVVREAASETLGLAQSLVPVEAGELSASSFVSGPEISRKHSVTATCGYEAQYAGAVHEGFHYGIKFGAPPKWLEQSVDVMKLAFRESVKTQVEEALSQLLR